MKTKTHFAFRVDIWDDTGDSIVEHVAGVDDFEVATAASIRLRLQQAKGPSQCDGPGSPIARGVVLQTRVGLSY
jgi:hypothetical protein